MCVHRPKLAQSYGSSGPTAVGERGGVRAATPEREPLLVQNVVAPSAHAVLHDLIRLRAGIGAHGAAVAAIAAGGCNHADSRTFLAALDPEPPLTPPAAAPLTAVPATASR